MEKPVEEVKVMSFDELAQTAEGPLIIGFIITGLVGGLMFIAWGIFRLILWHYQIEGVN